MPAGSSLQSRCPNLYAAFNSDHLQLAESDKAPDRFLLLRCGECGWAGPQAFVLDAETAETIIAAFDEQGVKLPIDYHHATEKVGSAPGAKAPAAGHIGKLEYVEGEGLYASSVEWTNEGRDDVEARRFLYTSPAILHDDDLNILAVSSCALTNKPRTLDAEELLAAAELCSQGDKTMDKYATLKTRCEAVAKGLRLSLAQDAEEITEFPAIAADQKAIVDLILALQAKGADIADDATLATVLQAAIEMLGEEPTEEPTEEEAAAAEAERKKAETDKVKADSYEDLDKRFKAMESQLAERDAKEKSARVDQLIEDQVSVNKLNPQNEKAMKSARALAESDEGQFVALFESITPYAPVGTQVTKGASGGGSRSASIRKACAEYDANPKVACGASKRYWVDECLKDEDQAVLSSTEIEKLQGD